MRPVWSIVAVKAFLDRQLLLEIHVVLVGEELVGLVLVASMRALDLSVELGCSWLDVNVLDALVRDMAVEERLELVAAIGSDGLDPERELLYHVVDEVDGIGLGVALVDVERTNSRGVADRRVLVTSDRRTPFSH